MATERLRTDKFLRATRPAFAFRLGAAARMPTGEGIDETG